MTHRHIMEIADWETWKQKQSLHRQKLPKSYTPKIAALLAGIALIALSVVWRAAK